MCVDNILNSYLYIIYKINMYMYICEYVFVCVHMYTMRASVNVIFRQN